MLQFTCVPTTTSSVLWLIQELHNVTVLVLGRAAICCSQLSAKVLVWVWNCSRLTCQLIKTIPFELQMRTADICQRLWLQVDVKADWKRISCTLTPNHNFIFTITTNRLMGSMMAGVKNCVPDSGGQKIALPGSHGKWWMARIYMALF